MLDFQEALSEADTGANTRQIEHFPDSTHTHIPYTPHEEAGPSPVLLAGEGWEGGKGAWRGRQGG